MFIRQKLALRLAFLAATLSSGACVMDATENNEQTEIAVEENAQALWSNLDKGALAFRQTTTGALSNGDFSHYYKFVASAGQTVNFAVEWKRPESNGLGAVIRIKNSTGTTTLAEHATLASNQAHLVYTFATAGTYRIYVKHYGYALFGSYPYKVGAEPDLCATWEGTYDGFEQGIVSFTSAANFPEYLTSDPWAVELGGGLYGDERFHANTHSVAFGDCAELVRASCGSEGPEVFEVWFPTGSLEVVPNACEMRNDVYETAGTTDGWMLWWDTCERYPEACQESEL